MKELYIIKLGTTFAAIAGQYGDFDAWTTDGLRTVDMAVRVADVEHGAALPNVGACAGVVVTGSHAMVTDDLSWSMGVQRWIPGLLAAGVPFLGICYGHQLLAKAMGGRVGFHAGGKEIGTVQIRLWPESAGDALFGPCPERFLVHATHSQTVLRLPPGATRLAKNTHEPHQAFRIGDCAWGVQFHPEYTSDIMRAYIREQSEELESTGWDIHGLLGAVRQTPEAARILRRFARIVEEKMAD